VVPFLLEVEKCGLNLICLSTEMLLEFEKKFETQITDSVYVHVCNHAYQKLTPKPFES